MYMFCLTFSIIGINIDETKQHAKCNEEKSKSSTTITESSGGNAQAETEHGTDDRRWSRSLSRRTGFKAAQTATDAPVTAPGNGIRPTRLV
jgi:hypothetical protein